MSKIQTRLKKLDKIKNDMDILSSEIETYEKKAISSMFCGMLCSSHAMMYNDIIDINNNINNLSNKHFNIKCNEIIQTIQKIRNIINL